MRVSFFSGLKTQQQAKLKTFTYIYYPLADFFGPKFSAVVFIGLCVASCYRCGVVFCLERVHDETQLALASTVISSVNTSFSRFTLQSQERPFGSRPSRNYTLSGQDGLWWLRMFPSRARGPWLEQPNIHRLHEAIASPALEQSSLTPICSLMKCI